MPDSRPHVLVVDDDLAMAEAIADGLEADGFRARAVADPQAAWEAVSRAEHDALVTDLRMAQHDGLALLALSQRAAPGAPVIVMTAFSAIDTAVESIRRGAYHYLAKPFKVEELTLFLRRALEEAAGQKERRSLKQALRASFAARHVLGTSPAMREVGELVGLVARADVPVLVQGETGTGKGLVARAIHAESPRSQHSFVSLNCAALPESLVESELFGHARGSFTGADSAHAGLFEEAHAGTIFLDEIAELPLSVQAKLLHVLESGQVRRIGETRDRSAGARIIAATNRDLRALVQAGRFREDLLYRLDVVSIDIPALRYRGEDIPLLAEHFLQVARGKHPSSPAVRFSASSMDALCAYAWPGNVRELEHVAERAVLLARDAVLEPSSLPRTVTAPPVADGEAGVPHFGDVVQPLRTLQRRYVQWAFERCGGSKRATCDALEIDYKTLVRWLADR